MYVWNQYTQFTVLYQYKSWWIYSCCFVFIAEPLSRSPCELLPVGVGHPVQAMRKSFTALSGCASRGTISLPQEVHVVNLRGHEAEGARNTLPEVSELKWSYTFYYPYFNTSVKTHSKLGKWCCIWYFHYIMSLFLKIAFCGALE